MKFRVLLISLTLLMGRYAICQCGEPTFTKDNKVRDVKQKLTCFANENATLKQKVAELQANLTSSTIHLGFSGEAYNPGVYPMSQCKSNAIEAVANEGGRLIGNGNDWTVGFEINGMKVAVICQSPNPGGYVFIAAQTKDSAGESNAEGLARRLAKEIFGPGQHQ